MKGAFPSFEKIKRAYATLKARLTPYRHYLLIVFLKPNPTKKTAGTFRSDDPAAVIRACLTGDRKAQRVLYDAFKDKMFGVCLRFSDNREEAEDLLQDGFVRVFSDLAQYRMEGSFEGWIRRIMVRVALQHLRQKKVRYVEFEEKNMAEMETPFDGEPIGEDMARHLLHLMQRMPAGFRTVLNLYVFEGMTHAEIGVALGISEGTSKSQYMRAKEHLRRMVEQSLSL